VLASSNMAGLEKQLQALQALFAKSPASPQVGQALTALKLSLAQAGCLTPADGHASVDFHLARETLELGALYSIRCRDAESFERYFAQLKTFYHDLRAVLPPSSRELMLVGLNLLRLLAQNRIAEFHTELELIPSEALHGNVYIKHPVEIEQWLMEGSYNKVIQRRQEAPAEEYLFFLDTLVVTIRNEIAECSQRAYESLPVAEAAKLMYFDRPDQFLRFCLERQWTVNGATHAIEFQRPSEVKTRQDIPAHLVMDQMLHYAQDLDRIV